MPAFVRPQLTGARNVGQDNATPSMPDWGSVESVRVDKWLWSIRLYKTRTAAGQACRAGHVRVNGDRVKPSAVVRIGDEVDARVGDWPRRIRVVELIQTRVGAPVAVTCYTDHSPAPPSRDITHLLEGVRDAGTGRPTKRDRREMERLKGRRGRSS
ncbi:MAG: RNA-binding S4 domain-containing protein [Euzebya sp.]